MGCSDNNAVGNTVTLTAVYCRCLIQLNIEQCDRGVLLLHASCAPFAENLNGRTHTTSGGLLQLSGLR